MDNYQLQVRQCNYPRELVTTTSASARRAAITGQGAASNLGPGTSNAITVPAITAHVSVSRHDIRQREEADDAEVGGWNPISKRGEHGVSFAFQNLVL